MSYAHAPHRGRLVLRFALATVGLMLAGAAVRGLADVASGQLTMSLAGILTIIVPGWATAGVLELERDRGPVTAWGLVPLLGVAIWAPFGLVGLLIGLPFLLVLAAVGVATAAMIAAGPCLRAPPFVDAFAMLFLGALAAAIGRQWQSWLIGDGLFHAGVIRKLLALSAPNERNIWPFLDGHPHAGYAFPLLHLGQAGAIWISSLDTGTGYPDLVPLFALMMPIVAYAVGVRAGGRIAGGITALLALWIAATGDNIISTAQQPRYFVTLVALPALLLLLLEQAGDPQPVIEWLVVACVLVITFCHLTYAPPLLAAMIVVSVFNPQLWRATLVSAVVSGAVVALIYVRLGARRRAQPAGAAGRRCLHQRERPQHLALGAPAVRPPCRDRPRRDCGDLGHPPAALGGGNPRADRRGGVPALHHSRRGAGGRCRGRSGSGAALLGDDPLGRTCWGRRS